MTECPTRVFREGWLANWLITERVTGLGGSCIQLTQCDMNAHGLIVVKEITHTHIHTQCIYMNILRWHNSKKAKFRLCILIYTYELTLAMHLLLCTLVIIFQ